MGDTGEIPLLFKGYKLALNFWHRVHSLPNEILVKQALNENVVMRSTWIRTIEKLFDFFKITYTENRIKFKAAVNKSVDNKFMEKWNLEIHNTESGRLEFYKTIKNTFGYEDYLELKFEFRKNIAKIRCSSHILEIERGRHSKTARMDRLCTVCDMNEVETEDHFLTNCPTFRTLRDKCALTEFTRGSDLFSFTTPNLLGYFITEALLIRKAAVENTTVP